MTRAIVIVDTNVVVAGLITAQNTSPVARILDGMLTAAFPYVVSEALLAEYRTVLARPGLRKFHGLAIAEVEAILTDVALQAIVLSPVPGPDAPDPGDPLLWDLLAAGVCRMHLTIELRKPKSGTPRSEAYEIQEGREIFLRFLKGYSDVLRT